MKTIFVLIVMYIICIPHANAYHNVSLFHPWILQRCIRNCSWTMWFNVGKPFNLTSGDSEDTAEIIAQNPYTMCKTPMGVEAQTINYQTGNWDYEWRVTQTSDNISLVSFYSTEPGGVDFRVRYCCSSPVVITTTTISTTVQSISSDNSKCGIQEIKPQTSSISRIFGEIEATANSWPWIVYVHKPIACHGDETCSIGCSAILIDKDHLITVAHCIDIINPTDITLIAGVHDLSSISETDTRQMRTIKQIFLHPEYNSLTNINDIAVLRVNTSFMFTKYVQPACLPDDKIQSNEKIIAINWRKKHTKILKQVYTTVANDCNIYWPLYDNNRQVCVFDTFHSNVACDDNESGTILTLRKGQYVVEGIANYVKQCNILDQRYKPMAYTRISAFKAWINQIIE